MFIDGKLDRTLRGDGLVDEFIEILEDYVATSLPDRPRSPSEPDRRSTGPPVRVYTPGRN